MTWLTAKWTRGLWLGLFIGIFMSQEPWPVDLARVLLVVAISGVVDYREWRAASDPDAGLTAFCHPGRFPELGPPLSKLDAEESEAVSEPDFEPEFHTSADESSRDGGSA